jgi:predicted Zn-ribbon and HTH transcriptional regulator
MGKRCKRCGYKWIARVERPKACPECKRRDWDKEAQPKPLEKGFFDEN